MVKQVIYIHGFNSSERSQKAVQFGEYLTQQRFAGRYVVPRLSHDPAQAMADLTQLIDEHTVLLGSSLGGFYATYLSQQFNLPAVVINPAVRPFTLLHDYLGKQYNPYQDYHYHLEQHHVDALKSLYLEQLASPELLFLLQQEGDEVLPYTQALAYYKGCRQIVEPGGNHSFIGFQRHFASITEFFYQFS